MFASLWMMSTVGNGIPLWLGAESGALAGGAVSAALLATLLVIGVMAWVSTARSSIDRVDDTAPRTTPSGVGSAFGYAAGDYTRLHAQFLISAASAVWPSRTVAQGSRRAS
jgi:hypothetical protein